MPPDNVLYGLNQDPPGAEKFAVAVFNTFNKDDREARLWIVLIIEYKQLL